MKITIRVKKGGPGSGFRGHAGRPGRVGGSASSGGGGVSWKDFGDAPRGVPGSYSWTVQSDEEKASLAYGKEMWSTWRDDLTNSERLALQNYSGVKFLPMNRQLRRGSEMAPEMKRSIKLIDSAISRDSAIVKENLVVYRGIPSDVNVFGELKPGDVFSDRGFVSTSFLRAIAMEFQETGTLCRIRVPKGTHGGFLSTISIGMAEMYQQELLLPRNTQFKFLGESNGIIDLEVIND